jgi:hypothetical protein
MAAVVMVLELFARKATAVLVPGRPKLVARIIMVADVRTSSYCGQGYLYCSAPSCQIDYGPACDANVRPNGPNTRNTPRPQLGNIPYGDGFYRCIRNGDIALTYDDGPYSYTKDLLDLLAVSTILAQAWVKFSINMNVLEYEHTLISLDSRTMPRQLSS